MKFSSLACAALVATSSNAFYVQAFGVTGGVVASRGKIIRPMPTKTVWGSSRILPNHHHHIILKAKEEGDEEEEEKEVENPYADPNYPELEFVNYDDPDYVVDQGEIFQENEDDTLEQIEAMREERRRRNDEFQFETYHSKILKNGEQEYRGEWTVYRTSTFLNGMSAEEQLDANGMPRLVKSKSVLRTVSSGKKIQVETDSDWRVDGERIEHLERMATEEEVQGLLIGEEAEYNDDLATLAQLQSDKEYQSKLILECSYRPSLMSSFDFRGVQGNMICGNSYTVCDAVPLPLKVDNGVSKEDDDEEHDGPFAEMRTEIGIQDDSGKRFRIKFDYRIPGFGPDDDVSEIEKFSLEESNGSELPPLMLSSFTVCREALDRWPISTSPVTSDEEEEDESKQSKIDYELFGPPGAAGGLYDPPPVGSDSQASQYMLIDLEGGATILFPYKLDQDPNAHDGKAKSWVTSLDWSSGKMRYQVDRKVLAHKKLKGLKTLELSEVQASDADVYRPRDGGTDMRQ
uniref:Uncharacterized protein n=1 Tax=Helicotheca tamesis TaxID=374047 RepID=A0A7S2IC14_9STRA|mmetsp:Transcript_7845/g.10750  ORF Transcript_7845/g.10750 Transcript_7845/m.10750 type:complete len:517 (+) Transcript_7845:125-1675(+)|eukprot:CAMPEP_0185730402 /NCGR_PEP_ID=MMETSP1171-20130828/9728_1 /TAXON_ID=374046 /ORGANISM="Helicotheca tamensis, Strain CCMP826" /LENGTH=516 /DNA_ID=CAMNT_0028399433 /DNA_START=65 /DNA_END=1615 /DNA_ORIENTATION=-